MERASAEGPVISGFSGRGFKVDEGVYEGLLITPSAPTAGRRRRSPS
jgi:hypothetical protein